MSFVLPSLSGSSYFQSFLAGWGFNQALGQFEFPDIRPLVRGETPEDLERVVLTAQTAPLMVGTLFAAAADLARADTGGPDVAKRPTTMVPAEVFDYVGDALGIGLRELVTPGQPVALPIDLAASGVSLSADYTSTGLKVVVRQEGRTTTCSVNPSSGEWSIEPSSPVRDLKVGDLTLKTGVIPDLLRMQVERYGDRAFLKVPSPDGGYQDVSFREFDQRVERMKRALHAHGVCQHDRVAFLSPNKPAFVEASMGVWGLGATVVSMSVRAVESDELMEHMVTAPDAKTLVVSAGPFLAAARKLKAKQPDLKILVLDPLPPAQLQEGEVSLATWQEGETPVSLPAAEVTPNDVALVLFTSGTTKLPKAVPLTHLNLLYNREASRRAWEGKLTDEDMTLGWLPFFHVMGLPFEFLGDLYVGARYAFPRLRPGPPTPDQLLAALRETGANVLYSVPAMLGGFRAQAQRDPEDLAALKRLKFLMTGGAPTDDSVGQWFLDHGIAVINGYGMTEVAGAIALGDPGRPDWRTLHPLPGVRIALDAVEGVDGRELVLEDCPTVTRGYLQNAAATEAAFRERGRFHTGDVFGEVEDGIEHRGRNDELFVHVTGEKTNPQPIELELQKSHDVIQRVCLVGHGKPFNVAIVQPNYAALGGRHWTEIEQAIWEVFDRVNPDLMNYSQIRRKNIIILPPGAAPMPTAPKGSLIRPAIEKRFEAEIEALHARKEQERRRREWLQREVDRIRGVTDDLRDLVKRVSQRDFALALVAERRRAAQEGVTVTGKDLNVAHLMAVEHEAASVRLSDDPAVRSRVDEAVAWLARAMAEGREVYGANAGYGGDANKRTTRTTAMQEELIRFLNSTFGDLLPDYVVRGAMLIRANSNAKGYSGIRWQILENIVALLNKGIVPCVPTQGSITASGDLSPLSHIIAVLMGKESARAHFEGRTISAQEALVLAGLEPITLGPKEGLAFVNGTSVAAAYGAAVLYDSNVLALLAQAGTAMIVETMLGTDQSFDPLLQRAQGHRGQIEVGANLLYLLGGSQLARRELDGRERIPEGGMRQDYYALRTAPKWLGPQIEDILAATERLTTELNAFSDNPMVDVDGDRAVHGGAFQGTPVAMAMEHTRLALQAIGKIVFAQFAELVNARSNNGLPSELAGSDDPGTDFGLKGVDINMAAYMAELAWLAHAVTPHVQSAELHNQDVNSLGLIAARMASQSATLLQKMLASQLYATTQAADLRHIERAYREATAQAVERAVDRTLATVVQNAAEVAPLMKWYLVATARGLSPFHFVYGSGKKYKALFERLAGELDDVLVGDPKAVGETRVTLVDDSRAVAGYYRVLQDAIKEELDRLLPPAKQAALQQGAAHLLGQTRSLYTFVRRDLGVRFEQADRDPGPEIEKIFDAIRDGRIVDPLLEAFFPGEPA